MCVCKEFDESYHQNRLKTTRSSFFVDRFNKTLVILTVVINYYEVV